MGKSFFGFQGLAEEMVAQAKNLAWKIPHLGNWDDYFTDKLNVCLWQDILDPIPDTFWGTGSSG